MGSLGMPYAFAAENVNLHVGNLKSLGEKEKISTWTRNKTSEESNETSEELFLAYVENQK